MSLGYYLVGLMAKLYFLFQNVLATRTHTHTHRTRAGLGTRQINSLTAKIFVPAVFIPLEE